MKHIFGIVRIYAQMPPTFQFIELHSPEIAFERGVWYGAPESAALVSLFFSLFTASRENRVLQSGTSAKPGADPITERAATIVKERFCIPASSALEEYP